MSDAPGRFVIRPDPRRYLRHALGAAPLSVIATATVTARLAGELGWLAGPAVLALVGPPVGLFCAYAGRHSRTVALALVGGALSLTDWRGRQRTLPRPRTVLRCTVYSGGGRMEHTVIGGTVNEIPLVLRTRQWRPADLDELFRRLGVPVADDDLMSVPGVRSRFPGAPLPYATRYPITVGLVWALLAFGYIAAIVSIFRALALA